MKTEVAEVTVRPRPFLEVSITFMVVWLFMGFLLDLPVSGFAKATSGLAFIPVLLLSRSWRTPAVLFAYPAVALYLFFAVSGTADRTEALVIRLYWLLLILAAIALASRVNEGFPLQRVLNAVLVGGAVCLGLLVVVLFAGDELSVQVFGGRVWVFGGNPNLLDTIPTMILPLALLQARRTGRTVERYVWVLVSAIAVLLLLVFVGRAALVIALIPSIPFLWAWWRRPAAIALPLLALGLVVSGPLGQIKGEELDLERLLETGSAVSRRAEIAGDYLTVISQRPLFGIAPTVGNSADRDPELGTHTHSSLLDLLYLGGVMAFIPMLAVSLAAVSAGIHVLRKARRDRVLLLVLFLQLLMSLAHAVTNRVVFHPTYAWAFYHVFLASYFLILASRQKTPGTEETSLAQSG